MFIKRFLKSVKLGENVIDIFIPQVIPVVLRNLIIQLFLFYDYVKYLNVSSNGTLY